MPVTAAQLFHLTPNKRFARNQPVDQVNQREGGWIPVWFWVGVHVELHLWGAQVEFRRQISNRLDQDIDNMECIVQ